VPTGRVPARGGAAPSPLIPPLQPKNHWYSKMMRLERGRGEV